jgi:uncharacterized protein (TIGR02594 family)
VIQTTPKALPPTAVKVPTWIAVALGEIGVVEDLRKGKSTPRVEQYHAITRAGPAVDDVSWCASFVSWCLEMGGVSSTKSKTAASYTAWGVACELKFGAVVFFGTQDKDAGHTGHVGFCVGVSGEDVFLLGGNQNQRVEIGVRKKANVTAIRWPMGVVP